MKIVDWNGKEVRVYSSMEEFRGRKEKKRKYEYHYELKTYTKFRKAKRIPGWKPKEGVNL